MTPSSNSSASRRPGVDDRRFWIELARLAVPVTLQTLTASLATMIDVVMLGRIGQAEVAAVGMGASAFFVAICGMNGATSAVSVLAAQHHGAGDTNGTRRVVAQGLAVAGTMGLALWLLFFGCSSTIVGWVNDEPAVLGLATRYVDITSFTFVALAVQLPIASALSGIGRPSVNFAISGLGVTTNVALNWILIFGHLGAPAMGLEGAAIATTIARMVEALAAACMLLGRSSALRSRLREIPDALATPRLRKFLDLSVPLGLNGVAWATGMFVYDMIYGSMGSQEFAVMTVLKPIMNLCFAFFWGVASAAGIIVGQDLGARRYTRAYHVAWATTALSVAIASLGGVVLWLAREPALASFSALPTETQQLAHTCVFVAIATLWLRSVNVTVICGVLQSGGEHRFILRMDLACQWACGIPLCFAAHHWLDLSLAWVFGAAAAEELVKMFVCVPRMISRRWQRCLVADADASAVAG